MLPTEDLFVCIYVLIDDLVTARIIAIPPRPGPAPGCSDAELLTIATTRHVLGRRSEAGLLAEVARDWAHLFPHLPHQSEANRRIRWLRKHSRGRSWDRYTPAAPSELDRPPRACGSSGDRETLDELARDDAALDVVTEMLG